MAKWQHRILGDCLKLISGGTPSKARNEYWGGDIPWISCKDMKVAHIHDAEDHLTTLGANNGTRLVPENTILFVVRGMILAREFPVAMTKREVAFNQDLKAVRPADFIDTEFLFHWFRANTYEILGRVDEAGHGTKRLQTDRLLSLQISVPPLPIQRRIAGILSAYDDLIENCQRRIAILEGMARALYREWFVSFRFPGHESHPSVPSPLGEIPEGWKACRIGDRFQTVLGGTPSRSTPSFWENGTISWINSGKVNDLRIIEASEFITETALERSAAKMMPIGTTVLAITGATLGQVSYLEIATSANQSVVGIVDPTRIHSEWIYLTITDRIEGIIKHASGGAQQHINKEIINEVLVLIPPGDLATAFKNQVSPLFQEISTLLFKSRNLRRTRDLLLPRLLSGQIDVEGLAS